MVLSPTTRWRPGFRRRYKGAGTPILFISVTSRNGSEPSTLGIEARKGSGFGQSLPWFLTESLCERGKGLAVFWGEGQG